MAKYKKPSKIRSKWQIGLGSMDHPFHFPKNGSVVEYCRADELGTYTHKNG
jgi:hypothetical protein